jgi:hypothetical protein
MMFHPGSELCECKAPNEDLEKKEILVPTLPDPQDKVSQGVGYPGHNNINVS